MKLVLASVIVVLGPLLFVWGFVKLSRLSSRITGFAALEKLYAWPSPPVNTTLGAFSVGLSSNSAGSVGADSNDLYLHGGFSGEGVRIPWAELKPVWRIGRLATLRERQTGLLITVSQRFEQPGNTLVFAA